MASNRYLIALGGNCPHPRHGSPRAVIKAAFDALDHGKLAVDARAPIIETPPLGPSRRRFANAAAVVRTKLAPEDLLRKLQKIERRFGRKRRGVRWGARVLDLDIVLWSGGAFASKRLVVPHPRFRERLFVLKPALSIAPGWRDPLTGLSIRHLNARATKFTKAS